MSEGRGGGVAVCACAGAGGGQGVCLDMPGWWGGPSCFQGLGYQAHNPKTLGSAWSVRGPGGFRSGLGWCGWWW